MPPAHSTQVPLPLAKFYWSFSSIRNVSETDNLQLCATQVKAQLLTMSGPDSPNIVQSLYVKITLADKFSPDKLLCTVSVQ